MSCVTASVSSPLQRLETDNALVLGEGYDLQLSDADVEAMTERHGYYPKHYLVSWEQTRLIQLENIRSGLDSILQS
jgi:hypothetical protein